MPIHHRAWELADVDGARHWLAGSCRRDRTEGQAHQVWVLEKAALGAQIETWTEEYGIPTAALPG